MPAIGIHHTATNEDAWDGPGMVARLKSGEDVAYYAKMYAWRDPEADETTKSAYKFPHHVVSDDGTVGAANVRGCQSGIGVLNGAMGGANIPDGDRQGVYRHLSAHLRDADVEPPELKSARSSSADSIQFRSFPFDQLRVDLGNSDQPPRIQGHAAVFNTKVEFPWGWEEIINPGAFKKTIKEADVRALFNHDPNFLLGRTKAKTLFLAEDEIGLADDIRPPATALIHDLVLVPMDRGDLNQQSFGFEVLDHKWEGTVDAPIDRILEVRLWDVSPVTFPAYPTTDAALRSIRQAYELFDRITLAPDTNETRFIKRCIDYLSVSFRSGRVLSAANEERLRQADALLNEVLNQLDKEPIQETSDSSLAILRKRLDLLMKM